MRTNLDGLTVRDNPVAYGTAAAAVIAPDVYDLAARLLELAADAVALDDQVETIVARMVLALVGFALGGLVVQSKTVPTHKIRGQR